MPEASMTIVVPMVPPAECSPNARAHWRAKAQATKTWRHAAYYAAYDAWSTQDTVLMLPEPVVMDIRIAWSGRRKMMDDDNAIAACKPMRDGIAEALLDGSDRLVTQGTMIQSRGDGTTTVTLRTPDSA